MHLRLVLEGHPFSDLLRLVTVVLEGGACSPYFPGTMSPSLTGTSGRSKQSPEDSAEEG